MRRSNEGVEGWLKNMPNCTVYEGHGRFEGPHTVRVGDQVLEADKIFVDVGARAWVPPMPGLNTVDFLTNSSMLALDYLPKRLIVVGGSYIGLEFAQIYRRFLSEVTIVEMGPRLIRREAEDVSEAVKGILEAEGIDVRLQAECISVAKRGDDIVVNLDCDKGTKEVVWTHLLLAVGRRPNTDDLESNGPASTWMREATSLSMTSCEPTCQASGRSATVTARAPSPTPRTTTLKSSPLTCCTMIRGV